MSDLHAALTRLIAATAMAQAFANRYPSRNVALERVTDGKFSKGFKA